MRRAIFLFFIFSAVSICPATTITVDNDGPADFNKIQAAIDTAVYGDTVSVAAGAYTENITLKNGVAVIGAGAENCIIDGNLNGSVVTSNSCDPNTVLDGFTITNGSVTWGFVGHGGMYNDDNSSPTVKNCIFKGNEGGGMVNGDSKPVVTNCIFSNNTAFFYGGGMLDANSSPEVINCTFSCNSATLGGGMYNWVNSNPIVRNCIIWANTAGVEGDEIYNFDIPDYPSIPVISYCDIEGCGGSGAGWDSSLGTDGGGNIDIDPLFADADVNDFHLKSQAGRWDANSQSWVKDANTSPCIDAGDPNSDWKAELWPHGKRINMGTYGGTPQASMSLSTAGNIADLDNDGDLDFNDVKLFTEGWLKQQVLLAADLDRNGDVNFVDFVIFGSEWYKENAPLGMTYQIGGCSTGLSVVKELDATRFTVTVNGHYIHFEDIMKANCCATELWLEMYVSGDQVIIYEREIDERVCICICDYPVEAELGPFKRGTYILGVYEDYGGFIGSATVTVE